MLCMVHVWGQIFDFLRTYHSFLSYSAYMVGILCFILTLQKGLYKYQFKQFAWTHLAIVVIIFQSSLFLDNLMTGIYWVIFPASLVVGNDCAAYVCGFFYGATPLIKLSPKKVTHAHLRLSALHNIYIYIYIIRWGSIVVTVY